MARNPIAGCVSSGNNFINEQDDIIVFITLEGPDGSGKSSQMNPLAEFIRQRGYSVFITREPGGTEISDQVRSILGDLRNKGMHPRTEILLFCAARAQLVEEVIRPRLQQGEIVISDRYADSTLAYQGYGHGVDLDLLRNLLNFTTGNLWPELTLYLDVEAEEGLSRRRRGGGEWNRLDDYALDFHKRVRQGYLKMAQQEPQRWCIIDANRPKDLVQEDIFQIISKALPGK
jgi:dTMP kinase